VELCRKRYQVFKTHYSAILRLKQFFPFHLIDAMGSLQDTSVSCRPPRCPCCIMLML
jgi:hypothetical protein